ncbi:MAG: cytochrome c [Acidobacteria bacterium]|nr:cytochrome c [Acidobacteriota bacterium]
MAPTRCSPRRFVVTWHVRFGPALLLTVLSFSSPSFAGQTDLPAARALTSGEAIFQAGCAGCHGPNGQGAPQATIGFDKPATFPDFTDCAGTTPELDVDWRATIRDGGHGRGFSPIMPSFREELTPAQIDAVIAHLRTLCRDRSFPRGELNLPRPLRTEKAFPESETVVTAAVGAQHSPDVDSELGYEYRLSARNQLEIAVPFSVLHDDTGHRVRGVGDIAVGLKRVVFASRNAILSGQGEIILPSGNTTGGIGSGVTTFGAFASYGQLLPADAFVQFQLGTDQPTSTENAARTLFWRAAVGKSIRADAVGRMWSPMFELVSDREFVAGATANIDVVPQFQVTLNRRQHIRVNVGYQIPTTNRAGRPKQVVFYLLWDWFDGGFFEGWK